MRSFTIRYRMDGTYYVAGDRERKITSEQSVRLLNLLWQQPNDWRTESITVFERKTGNSLNL